MSLEALAPSVLSARIFQRMRKALVFGSVANREYEGELTFGRSITIPEVSAITTNTYTRRTDVTVQEPDSADKTLFVDQETYTAYDIEDGEMVQAKAKSFASDLASEAGYSMADNVDQYLAALYDEAGDSVTAATSSAGNILVHISSFQTEFGENNVPTGEAKFLIVPPWFHTYTLQAATGIVGHTGVPKTMSDNFIINGFVGELFGLNMLVSNNVNNDSSTWNIMGLTRRAMALVYQLNKSEMTRRELRAATLFKQFMIYGAKVTRPQALISFASTKG